MKQRLERFIHRLRTTENPFIRATLKHSPMYLGASLFSGIAGLAMTKYYTHVFTPAEYGVMSLYIVMFQYVRNIIAFGVDGAAQRPYFDFAQERRGEFIGTMIAFIAISSAGWLVVSAFVADFAIGFLGGGRLVFAVTMLLSVVYAYWNFFSRLAYNEHLSGVVAKQGFLQTFLNHATSAGFIGIANLGVLGYQLGSLVSYTTSALLYARNLARHGIFEIRLALRRDIVRRVLYFGIPGFFTVLVTTTFSYVDRVLLKHYYSVDMVGVYSLGYTIGMGLSLVVEAVAQAMYPTIMRGLDDDYEANIRRLRRFDFLYACGLMAVGVGILLLRAQIVALFSNDSFAGAAAVLPFVTFAYVMGGMYKNASVVLSYHDVVKFHPYLSAVAWGTGAALNFVLVPRYGGVGAAFSAFIAAYIYSFVVHLYASKYLHPRSRVLVSFAVILVGAVLLFAMLLKGV